MVARARLTATTALIAGPPVLAFFSGGYFDRPRLVAGIVVWVITAIAVVLAPRRLLPTMPAIVAVAGLVALTAWTGLSYEWAPLGERAQADVQRLLLYLGFFVACIGVLREPRARGLVEPGLALGAFAVIAYGLSGRLLPELVILDRSASADGRLEQPLTYWNATGALAAIGLVLCVRIAGDARRATPARAAAAFAAPALGLGVYLSFSRGALLALAAGLLALIALAPSARHQLRAALWPLGGAAIAVAVASRLSRVETLAPAQAGDQGQGLVMLAALVALGAAAAALTSRLRLASDHVPLARRRLAGAGLAALTVAAVAATALAERNTTSEPGRSATDPARFATSASTRYAYWDVALEAFAEHPLKGTGTGGFAVEWRRQPDRTERAVDAHSLYIETLSELGIVGLGFLLAFLGGVVAGAVGLHRRDPAAAAGPAAAVVVYAVHAGLDWDWEMPALTGFALLFAALLVSGGGRGTRQLRRGSSQAPPAPA